MPLVGLMVGLSGEILTPTRLLPQTLITAAVTSRSSLAWLRAGSAVFVVTLVGAVAQELVEQVAVARVHLYAVEARCQRAPGCATELAGDAASSLARSTRGQMKTCPPSYSSVAGPAGTGDGPTGSPPWWNAGWDIRPAWNSWMKMRQPAAWTASVTFCQPACYSAA